MDKIELIAGPCSAETREQMMKTATQLRAVGIRTLRAGLWKPRSHYEHLKEWARRDWMDGRDTANFRYAGDD